MRPIFSIFQLFMQFWECKAREFDFQPQLICQSYAQMTDRELKVRPTLLESSSISQWFVIV